MSDQVSDMPPRPIPPRPDECCGSGCVRCIYELYDEALELWEQQVAEIEAVRRQAASG